VGLAAALATLASLAVPGVAARAGVAPRAAVAGPAVPARRAAAHLVRTVSASQHPAGRRDLLLINGAHVVVNVAGGPGMVIPAARSGLAGAVMSMTMGGTSLHIPAAAVPYLGRGLDPRLFEPRALLAAEPDGRLHVEVRYRGRVPNLPGIHLTKASGGAATGFLTASSARVFGAALDRLYGADHTRGSYGTDGMFASGTQIALPGAAPAAPPHPNFPMHTLTVKGFNLAGKPDTGDFTGLFNVDDLNRLDPFIEASGNAFFHGTDKYSVPAGHYMLLALFGGSATEPPSRIVVLPQFTVSGNKSVTAREAAANSKITMVTPRPATVLDTNLWLLRRDAKRSPLAFEFLVLGKRPLWISPTHTRPTVGSLQVSVNQHLESTPGPGVPYEYTLSYTSAPGTVPAQRHVVHPADLATVHERFYQAVKAEGNWAFHGSFPGTNPDDIGQWFGFIEPAGPGLRLPGNLTEYTGGTGASRIGLDGEYQQFSGQSPFVLGTRRSLHPGDNLTENWGAYPLHPAPNVQLFPHPNMFGDTLPSASRAGNTLTLDIDPFDDNQPGHQIGALLPTKIATYAGHYQIDQNGEQIAGGDALKKVGDNFEFHTQALLGGKPSTVRFALDVTQTGKDYPLSTRSSTVWTWRSVPRTGTVPAGWTCVPFTQNHDCSVEPMMTLFYHVARMAPDGSAPAGRQRVGLSAGHLQLAKASRITGATVAVSFDGGKSWHPARVSGRGGHYTAAFSAPAGALVTLRTSATDAAGGSVTETITKAYRVAAAKPSSAQTQALAQTAALTQPRALAQPRPAGRVRAACGPVRPRLARCFALYKSQVKVNAAIAARAAGQAEPAAALTPEGWGAKSIESAYKLPVSRNPHQTVAVVDAMSTPHLAADLGVYRKQYGLPACTTGSGCLRIVNQQGKASPLPRADVFGWGIEETLDVSMVSAACPHCKLLVVEARSPSVTDLATAENTAARLGAAVISNSYGTRETGALQPLAKAYHHPGHTVVASSGDFGFTAASFPANLATVTAVGGTQLSRAHNARGWSEAVWHTQPGSAGSGCSAYVAKPGWQHDPHCPGRTSADVSALAWNIPIFDSSIPDSDGGPWLSLGGTSASSPLIAGVYALAGNAATVRPGFEYAHTGALFDVTKGNNDWISGAGGAVCGHDYLCQAKRGYDAPTGLGTPDGIGAF
jgi:hypothetical protein